MRYSQGPVVAGDAEGDCCHDGSGEVEATDARGFWEGMKYAYGDLFAAISVYLIPAILITALLTTILAPLDLAGSIGPAWLQMLILLLAGIPVYVCATAATPIAAALILSGFSPGAALVFLLTMKELPATLILSPIGFNTLATSIWSAASEAFFARAAAPALMLIAASSLPLAFLMLRERR